MPDLYQWRAIGEDGTPTTEYDESRPDGRGFAEVADKPIRAITLVNVEYAGEAQYSVIIPEGAQPFFTRRRTLEAGTQETTTKAHIIGWKRGDEGTYLFVFEDGSTLLSNDIEAI